MFSACTSTLPRVVATATLAVAAIAAARPAAAEPAPAAVVALAKSTIARLGSAPAVVKAVKTQNAAGASLADVQAHDRKWIATPGIADFMKALMSSDAGLYLARTAKGSPYYSEIFVTDKLGANVAMSAKTSDYWQGDEPKFTESWKGGRGEVFVSDVNFDKSTQKYIVHVSVPVKDGDAVIGVLVAGVDVAKVK
jgi:hypothetical protein